MQNKSQTTHKYYRIPKPPSYYDPFIHGLGIDFGITTCFSAVIKNNKIEVVGIDNCGERSLPSFVGYDEPHIKCGSVVVNRMRNYSAHTVYDVKRIIGKPYTSVVIDPTWTFEVIDDKKNVKIKTKDYIKQDLCLNPEEISAVLLEYIKQKVGEYKSEKVSEAVITVPAAFAQYQTDAIMDAAMLAKWDRIYILPEPIAACFTYLNEKQIPEQSIIFLFDLGGETLNICVAKIENEKLHILGNFGDLHLGGKIFDDLLINHFKPILKYKYNIDVDSNEKKYKLISKCQEIKHDLATLETATLHLDDFDPSKNDEVILLNNTEFKELCNKTIVIMNSKILEALDELKLSSNDISHVLQVGGACRMRIVKDLLKVVFPNAQHLCTSNPDWAIAYGATLYCCYLNCQYYKTQMKNNMRN